MGKLEQSTDEYSLCDKTLTKHKNKGRNRRRDSYVRLRKCQHTEKVGNRKCTSGIYNRGGVF